MTFTETSRSPHDSPCGMARVTEYMTAPVTGNIRHFFCAMVLWLEEDVRSIRDVDYVGADQTKYISIIDFV